MDSQRDFLKSIKKVVSACVRRGRTLRRRPWTPKNDRDTVIVHSRQKQFPIPVRVSSQNGGLGAVLPQVEENIPSPPAEELPICDIYPSVCRPTLLLSAFGPHTAGLSVRSSENSMKSKTSNLHDYPESQRKRMAERTLCYQDPVTGVWGPVPSSSGESVHSSNGTSDSQSSSQFLPVPCLFTPLPKAGPRPRTSLYLARPPSRRTTSFRSRRTSTATKNSQRNTQKSRVRTIAKALKGIVTLGHKLVEGNWLVSDEDMEAVLGQVTLIKTIVHSMGVELEEVASLPPQDVVQVGDVQVLDETILAGAELDEDWSDIEDDAELRKSPIPSLVPRASLSSLTSNQTFKIRNSRASGAWITKRSPTWAKRAKKISRSRRRRSTMLVASHLVDQIRNLEMSLNGFSLELGALRDQGKQA